jgi:hypothetical protein
VSTEPTDAAPSIEGAVVLAGIGETVGGGGVLAAGRIGNVWFVNADTDPVAFVAVT